MNLHPFLEFSKELSIEAGSIILKYFGNITSVKRKSTDIDLLTIADTESEKFILKKIISNYPDHQIISEESPIKDGSSDFRWIIDPLDGTTNFVHNLPIFSVSIGLQYKDETIVGVVYNPAANKCFYATKNGGSFLNGKSIYTTSTNTLTNSLLVTGFPYIHDDNWMKCFTLFAKFYGQTQGIRRLGAATLDLCFVAMGRFEGFWEFGLHPWDICAGSLILQEAGGKVTDWNGEHMSLFGKRILATNGHVHDEMVETLTKELF